MILQLAQVGKMHPEETEKQAKQSQQERWDMEI